MRASDIMTRNLAVVTPDEPVQRAAALMSDRNVGFVPVVADRGSMRLAGVLTDRDVTVRAVAEHYGPDRRVRECMTAEPLITVDEDADVHEVLAAMEAAQVRRVAVVDAASRLVGVISQGDLARRVGPGEPGAIEELVERVSAPSVPVHGYRAPSPDRQTPAS